MSDGNKRYLGDVFINEDNYEYQKQFFKDIIESYQWKYGGKFDASTLQEKTPEDFATAEQGAKADTAILAPLLLGQKEILNVAESQYIFTDAIKIDRNPETEDSSSFINFIKWFDSLDDNANLSKMLYTIYQKTIEITRNLDEIKLNKSVYETFLSSRFNPIETTFNRVFQDAIDPNTQELSHKLNADMVNGLIFHLITQQAYDNLSSEKKSSPRDIYIIVDQLPGDYEDPMQWPMENGFEFQIDEGKFQYKNIHDDTWRDICTLTELLSGADVRELVQDIMEEDIDEVIENIQAADVERSWAEYPFLSSSLHGVYAKDLKINGTHNYISSALDNNDSLKYLDLDMNQILIDNEVLKSDGSPKINEINNYFKQQISDHNDRITAINNNVSSLETQLGTDEENITSLGESITNLGGTINSNKSRIANLENNIGKKQGSEFPLVWRQVSDGLYDVRLYSNGVLGFVWIHWIQSAISNAGYGGINPHASLKNLSWIGTWYCSGTDDYEHYRCMSSHVTLDLSGRVQFLLNYDGKLYARSNTGQVITTDHFYATATYVCQGALRG